MENNSIQVSDPDSTVKSDTTCPKRKQCQFTSIHDDLPLCTSCVNCSRPRFQQYTMSYYFKPTNPAISALITSENRGYYSRPAKLCTENSHKLSYSRAKSTIEGVTKDIRSYYPQQTTLRMGSKYTRIDKKSTAHSVNADKTITYAQPRKSNLRTKALNAGVTRDIRQYYARTVSPRNENKITWKKAKPHAIISARK